MGNKNTHILAVTSESVDIAANGEEGLIRLSTDSIGLPFEANDVIIAPRDELEENSSYMQIIPYVITMRDGKILHYTRTNKGGEDRLHSNVSIGFGGHTDVGDVHTENGGQTIDLESTIANAIVREIGEELSLTEVNNQFNAVGMIVDRSNEVGRVHVGIVVLMDVNCMVDSKEDQIELLGFKTKDELLQVDNMENWSSIVLNSNLFV